MEIRKWGVTTTVDVEEKKNEGPRLPPIDITKR